MPTFEFLEPDQALSPLPEMSPDGLTAGTPRQEGCGLAAGALEGVSTGIWACTPFTTKPSNYPSDELMIVIEGGFYFETGEVDHSFGRGKAVLAKQGMPYRWHQSVDLKKFYIAFGPGVLGARTGVDPDALVDIGAISMDGISQVLCTPKPGQVGIALFDVAAAPLPVSNGAAAIVYVLEGEGTLAGNAGTSVAVSEGNLVVAKDFAVLKASSPKRLKLVVVS